MTSARNEILAQIRKYRPNRLPLPNIEGTWLEPADCEGYFCKTMESVGGRMVTVRSDQDVRAVLELDPRYRSATRVYSLFARVPSRGLSANSAEILRGESILDVTIASSNLAVAENAAVYLELPTRRDHALLFLGEHMFVVVTASAIVANMHQAYACLGAGGAPASAICNGPGFGVFISGPSKTADIEQALVIGAQGPRSLTVLLVEA